jgi:hypothetical protein
MVVCTWRPYTCYSSIRKHLSHPFLLGWEDLAFSLGFRLSSANPSFQETLLRFRKAGLGIITMGSHSIYSFPMSHHHTLHTGMTLSPQAECITPGGWAWDPGTQSLSSKESFTPQSINKVRVILVHLVVHNTHLIVAEQYTTIIYLKNRKTPLQMLGMINKAML